MFATDAVGLWDLNRLSPIIRGDSALQREIRVASRHLRYSRALEQLAKGVSLAGARSELP